MVFQPEERGKRIVQKDIFFYLIQKKGKENVRFVEMKHGGSDMPNRRIRYEPL
jgi:hypothetical protein